MAEGRVNQSVYVTLAGVAGSATGTAKLGPASAREVWHLNQASVSATPGVVFVNDAQCQIYVGDINGRKLRDGTVTGSTGDSSAAMDGDTIKVGEYVWAIWTLGDPVQHLLTVSAKSDI